MKIRLWSFKQNNTQGWVSSTPFGTPFRLLVQFQNRGSSHHFWNNSRNNFGNNSVIFVNNWTTQFWGYLSIRITCSIYFAEIRIILKLLVQTILMFKKKNSVESSFIVQVLMMKSFQIVILKTKINCILIQAPINHKFSLKQN